MGFRGALLRGLLGGGFAGATQRGLASEPTPPVTGAVPGAVFVRLRDYRGDIAPLASALTVDAQDTMAAIDGAIQAWLGALDNVTGAVILDCEHWLRVPLPGGIKNTATHGPSRVQWLTVAFANAQDVAAYAFAVPAPPNDILSGAAPDTATGASIDRLAQYMGATLAGTTGGHFTTERDGVLTEPLRAAIVERKVRRDKLRQTARAIV